MRNSLHVVFCLDNSGIGGTELNAVRTAERLVDQGHTIEVASLGRHPDLTSRYEKAGIPVQVFPTDGLASTSALRQGIRLRRFLVETEPDVFHAHDIYGNLFGVPWARMARVPVVLASRRWWKKEIRRGHGLANRVASRLAHAVVVNSPRVAAVARRKTGGTTRIQVVPNFVDAAAFQELNPDVRRRLLDELGVPAGRTIIGCVANLRPVKDHATLVRGVASLIEAGHDVHLVLVGDGECRDELSVLARELDVEDRVYFAGHRPHQPNLHHLFDISTLTSTDEAFSNSLLEAMAAGNPVVATRVGGTPDAVVDGETGLLVPPEAPGPLAEALERLVTDVELARRLGKAGKGRVLESFSPQAAMSALTDLYARLLDRYRTAEVDAHESDVEHESELTAEMPRP